MKKIKNFLIFLFLCCLCSIIYIFIFSVKPVAKVGDLPEWYLNQRVGAYHIHTQDSHDSEGKEEDLIKAAKENNLNFLIVTEHNFLSQDILSVKDDFYLIKGIENSTDDGHLVALNNGHVLNKKEKEQGAVNAIHENGGIAVVAHPTALKGGYQLKDYSKFDGIEIANSSTNFYNFIFPTRWLKGIASLASMYIDTNTMWSFINAYDDEAMKIWDSELERGHQMIPFCGLDAHNNLTYTKELGAYQMITTDRWYLMGNDDFKSRMLAKNIIEGDVYCRSGILGDVRLDFKANIGFLPKRSGSINSIFVKSMQAEVAPVPDYPIELRLIRNGKVVATTDKATLEENKLEKGAYRLEVWVKLPSLLPQIFGERWVPLIYSNSIILN